MQASDGKIITDSLNAELFHIPLTFPLFFFSEMSHSSFNGTLCWRAFGGWERSIGFLRRAIWVLWWWVWCWNYIHKRPLLIVKLLLVKFPPLTKERTNTSFSRSHTKSHELITDLFLLLSNWHALIYLDSFPLPYLTIPVSFKTSPLLNVCWTERIFFSFLF